MMEPTHTNARIREFNYPRIGDWYWDRYSHRIVRADHNMQEKFCILEQGVELEQEKPIH